MIAKRRNMLLVKYKRRLSRARFRPFVANPQETCHGSEENLRLLGQTEKLPFQRFFEVCWILLKKPHLVNSRLTGCSFVSCTDLTTGDPVQVDDANILCVNGLKIKRRLVPKNAEIFAPVLESCVLKQKSLEITTPKQLRMLLPPVVDPMIIDIRYENEECVSVYGSPEVSTELATTLLKRLSKWMQASSNNQSKNKKQVQVDSLTLVDIQTYSLNYAALKQRYGKKFVEIWPEKTNPVKFVYEDIAIASYLISLWDPKGTGKKVTFADIGCGNGLLVYILIQEGHKGFGADVRRRALWSLYPLEVGQCLIETAVSPDTRHSDIEWWIGNHSDELTLWIPLLATMSSEKAKVFLLPCCAYGLYGKFQRGTPELSQYQSYLAFLREDFLPDCGFQIEMDKLRIPSTKRVCFVARRRLDESYELAVQRMEQRLEKDKGTFVPRLKEIPVRNCTQISKSIADPMVDRIARAVLAYEHTDDRGYNRGGDLPLCDVVKLLKSDELKALKAQCGGLQTLLKNNYHIFKVLQGKVSLRLPQEKKEHFIRKRACWFNSQHPQGCPLNASSCRFQHG